MTCMPVSVVLSRGWSVAALCALLVLALAACSRGTPEERLRAQLAQLQQAVDARDASAVSEVLADDFVGNEGMDREAARRLALAVFMRHRDVGLRAGPLDVKMNGDAHATVSFTAAATAGSGGLLPDSAQVYRVRSGWRLQDGDWRLTSAQWSPQL